eukprot:TRINITY_DN336_c1_g1_i1.p1 TRINITY_DN336_c1_g1~~TRINITY_DN336_c1_g1_i1.p1  ORF type:complete len:106 (+),score=32.04 TRINITY_DN336_c1_g1_i1:100-417(+)
MRNNARWSYGARLEMEQSEFDKSILLTDNLVSLRNSLSSVKDMDEVPALHLLKPFLDIILSPSTTGLITDVALSSVLKFLQHNIVHPDMMDLHIAVNSIADAVTR